MLQMTGIKCSIYNQPTWYISALIIAGYLIYYLLSHHTKMYIELIAPFSIIFIYSFLSIKIGHVNVWIDDILFTKIALLRAFAGMSLGCMCYKVYEKLKTYAFYEKFYNILDLSRYRISGIPKFLRVCLVTSR